MVNRISKNLSGNAKILLAHIQDFNKLTELAIRSKSYWNYNKEQIEDWRGELTISEKYILENNVYKLIRGKTLIGFYSYIVSKEKQVKLDFLFIEPEFISQGFGKMLLLDFLSRMKKYGYQKINVEADPNSEKFYLKFGFQVIGKLESSIRDRYLPIMQKIL
jgi:N-acetylglutamate synthase-like GNAT family acetyltransferase